MKFISIAIFADFHFLMTAFSEIFLWKNLPALFCIYTFVRITCIDKLVHFELLIKPEYSSESSGL